MKPGDYIWKTPNDHRPVKVIKVLGVGKDGKTYVQVEGSTAGIPSDELHKIQPFSKLRKLLGLG